MTFVPEEFVKRVSTCYSQAKEHCMKDADCVEEISEFVNSLATISKHLLILNDFNIC